MNHNHDDSDRLADLFEQSRSDETTVHRGVWGQTGSGVTYPKGGAESDDNDSGGNQ
jgi:hypothetical protein